MARRTTKKKISRQNRELNKALQKKNVQIKKLESLVETLQKKEVKLEQELSNVINIKNDEDGAIEKLQKAIYGYKTHEKSLESQIEIVRTCLKRAKDIQNTMDTIFKEEKRDLSDKELSDLSGKATLNKALLAQAQNVMDTIEKEINIDTSLIGLMFKVYKEGRKHSKKINRSIKVCKKEIKSVSVTNNKIAELLDDFKKMRVDARISAAHQNYQATRSNRESYARSKINARKEDVKRRSLKSGRSAFSAGY